MKNISLKMSNNFKIELLARNNVYALENNSCKLSIDCEVDPDLAYKLHINHAGEKKFVLMDKEDDSISRMLTSSEIKENGVYYIQVEGIKDDYRIISNQIRLEVGNFINADYIPTPEEKSIIDDVLVKVSVMDSKVIELNSRVDEMYERADRGEFNGKDGKDGVDGKDGYTPVKGVDYFDGAKGDKGDKGDTGAKGDKGDVGAKGDKGDTGANGKDGINGTNGKDGSDGFSPIAKAERVDDGIVVTITDKNGTTTAKVNDGKSGEGGGNVDDVQINGTSIVQDGVAKIYEATANRYGVVKVSTSYGLNMTNGFITANVMSKNKYEEFPHNIVVGKGTLENIKSDLTKRALTDESQPAWTDKEKSMAQQRMGILSSEGVLF